MLSDDVIAFLSSIGGGMLCTRSGANQPAHHECLLARVATDHFIGLVPIHLSRSLPENVAANGDAAFVTSRVYGDHRSVQLKGKIAEFREPELYPSEIAGLFPALRSLFPEVNEERAGRMLAGMQKTPSYWLKFQVAQVFDQTPGPSAGRVIAGASA
jgi:hypothetical protein